MRRTLLSFSLVFSLLSVPSVHGAEHTPLIEQFAVTSPVFNNGGDIPDLYTCRGGDINPPLQIHNAPQGTRSLVIVVREPGNPITPWTHWIVYNIRPGVRDIKQGTVPGIQALNDFGNFYYGGPCVFDAAEHRFEFTVYALKSYLDDVNEGATFDILEKAMKGKILASAQMVGIYQNPLWGQDDQPL